MIINLASLASIALLPLLTISSPIDSPVEVAGSKHNVYLVRCNIGDCGIFCDPDDPLLTAAAYFSGGPVAEGSTRAVTPTRVGRSSGQWESSSSRSIRLGTDGTLTVKVPTSARTAPKGDLVGEATLGTEPFVCFKDGTTQFSIRYDDEIWACKTDYWCPSIDV